jgi:hypothetical protein
VGDKQMPSSCCCDNSCPPVRALLENWCLDRLNTCVVVNPTQADMTADDVMKVVQVCKRGHQATPARLDRSLAGPADWIRMDVRLMCGDYRVLLPHIAGGTRA